MKPMDRIEIINGEERFFLSRKEVTEEEYRAVYPAPEMGDGVVMGSARSGWPMRSEALATGDIERAKKYDEARGVATEYDRVGRPIFRDRAYRRAYLKARGVHANNSYGDD